MKKKHSIALKMALPVLLCVLTIATLGYFIISLKTCSGYFEDEAKSVAQNYTLQNSQQITRGISSSFDEIKQLATELQGVIGFENLDAVGNRAAEQYSLSCLQFLKDGEAEFRYGESVGSSTSEQFAALIAGRKFACSEIFTDMAIGQSSVAVFAPVENNAEINGLIAYYPVPSLLTADFSDQPLLQYYCLAESGGNILQSYTAEGFPTDVSHNFYTTLYNLTTDKDTLDEMEQKTKGRISDAYSVNISGESYIVAVSSVTNFGTDCAVFNIYEKHALLQNEYTLYDRMIGSSAGIILLSTLILTIYLFTLFRHKVERATLDETDPILGCNNYNKFVQDTLNLLSVNRYSSYAVVFFDINKFSFVKEHFDSETSDATIRHVANIVRKTVSDSETYGHMMDDRFVALMHYSDFEELTDRIRVIDALVTNFETAKKNNFSLSLAIGVYCIDRDKNYTVQQMVDRAIIAQKVNKKDPTQPYVVYDPSIRNSYLQEAEIETKMEYALKNHEFQVFFQPKYSIVKDRVDGAEALVRWYDPEKKHYEMPDVYIPFFEVNGFISKLDRFVFTEVCKYMKEAIEHGEKIIPISVNISRVTATKPDFLSYYIETKRKYGIANGFLMLEFTESFAYENYSTISEIVTALKANGFLCSIDDFGSGYSSFNILKDLKMDELKLDKLFLKPGNDFEKDRILLKTVIELGKNFDMKVTQEGVETAEQLKLLIEYECDVVQGYYYSKPLPISDFTGFIESDTSMNAIVLHHIGKKGAEKQPAVLGQ